MFCRNCGNQLPEGAAFCGRCGTSLSGVKPAAAQDTENDLIYAVIGFLFPIIGVILYLVYEKSRPNAARSAVKGAIISFIVGTILSVITIIGSIVIGILPVLFMYS